MAFRKIEDSDLQGKGNQGRPDTPGVSAAEMQRILDEVPKEVIVPIFNQLVEALMAVAAAGNIGAVAPEGTAGATIQEVLNSLNTKRQEHIISKNNPHAVTAAQVGAYTKAETEQSINEKVAEIGAGDMTKAEYAGSAEGVVKKADLATTANTATTAENANKFGSQNPSYYTSKESVQVFQCTFLLDGWSQSGGRWTQTVPCAGMRAAYDTDAPFVAPTFRRNTDELLREALGQLNDGSVETLDGQVRATLFAPPPPCDIEIFMRRAVK